MKKPKFNLFYSLPVFKLSYRGGGEVPAEGPKNPVTSEQKLDYIKTTLKPRYEKLSKRAKKALNLKPLETFGVKSLDPKFIDYKVKLEALFKIRSEQLLRDSDTSKLDFASYKAQIDGEFTKMEQLIDNVENKAFIAAELKKHFENTLLEYVRTVEGIDKPKAVNRKEILITASAYLARWHNANAKSLANLDDHAALIGLRKKFESNPPKGEIFDDLKAIKKDINKNVIEKWVAGLEDESRTIWRTVYKKGWEKRATNKISDKDLRKRVENFDKMMRTQTVAEEPGMVYMHPTNVQKTIKDYVAYLIKQKAENLPALPDSAQVRSIQGFDIKKLVASTKPVDLKGAPSKKLPEALNPKDLPKIAEMKYKNGTLTIVGENLPKKPLSIKVPSTIKASLVRGVKFEASDVGKVENINKQLTSAILGSIKEEPVKKALVKALKDPEKGAPILQTILKTGDTPTIKVYGRASWEGHWSGNKEVAMKRAEDGRRKIKKQVGNAARVVPVGIVVGPDGDEIKNPTQATLQATKMWNKKFNTKINSAEMKKIVKRYLNKDTKLTKPQVAFLESIMDKQRGLDVEVVAPKKPKQFTIKFESPKPTS